MNHNRASHAKQSRPGLCPPDLNCSTSNHQARSCISHSARPAAQQSHGTPAMPPMDIEHSINQPLLRPMKQSETRQGYRRESSAEGPGTPEQRIVGDEHPRGGRARPLPGTFLELGRNDPRRGETMTGPNRKFPKRTKGTKGCGRHNRWQNQPSISRSGRPPPGMKKGSRTGRDEPTENEGRILNETEAHRKLAGRPDHGARPVDIIENPRPGLIENTWTFSFPSHVQRTAAIAARSKQSWADKKRE